MRQSYLTSYITILFPSKNLLFAAHNLSKWISFWQVYLVRGAADEGKVGILGRRRTTRNQGRKSIHRGKLNILKPKNGGGWKTRWWFQTLPLIWGRWTQFDGCIFFRWVGSTINQKMMFKPGSSTEKSSQTNRFIQRSPGFCVFFAL